MLINEVCKKTKLTKKAIAYYIEQGLIVPVTLANGYRDFSDTDVLCLNKISVLRGLDVAVTDISAMTDVNSDALRRIIDGRELALEDAKARYEILRRLAKNADWDSARRELAQINQKRSILSRLIECFPGYYGKYVAMHFAPFLSEPIETAEQQDAFETIINYLDELDICIPEDLQAYLDEAMRDMGASAAEGIASKLNEVVENPEQYLDANHEMIEQYVAITETERFQATPAYRLKEFLKKLNSENGYNDVFIPAMRRLSASYRDYSKKLEKANRVFLSRYPI